MRAWDYTDIYVAACLRPFNTHAEGREHERWCPECQGIIRGEPEADMSQDDILELLSEAAVEISNLSDPQNPVVQRLRKAIQELEEEADA